MKGMDATSNAIAYIGPTGQMPLAFRRKPHQACFAPSAEVSPASSSITSVSSVALPGMHETFETTKVAVYHKKHSGPRGSNSMEAGLADKNFLGLVSRGIVAYRESKAKQ